MPGSQPRPAISSTTRPAASCWLKPMATSGADPDIQENTMAEATRTWLITGCSTGLGRGLAEVLIAKGERVFATARKPEELSDLVASHKNARALKLDVTVPTDIKAAVAEVEQAGGVDVLVNNAGYGYLTAIEEGDEDGYRAQFETNMFGLIAMTKAALPKMRQRGSGHIVNIASLGGLIGNPGSGYYAATQPPLNLVLGAPALKMAREKLAALTAELDRWEALTL